MFETDVGHENLLYKLPQVNLRARGDHLVIQLSRAAARLFV